MAAIEGYRVQTQTGKTVGHVAVESERLLVVECGAWPRKRWRALPKEVISIDEGERAVTMSVSRETLEMSPKLKRGTPLDEPAIASWWALS